MPSALALNDLKHDMEGQLHLHAGLADARSFRPKLYTTKHVSSDPEKKSHLHKHKSHHHHHDRHDHHRHSASRRQAAKEAVQSAIQPPTSFGDLLKQARGSKDPSPSHSRKGSVAPGQVDGSVNAKESGDVGVAILPRRPLRPEDVEKEGQRVEARERDLRTALQSLSEQSLKTSRRLDDTYYSILEKVSVLLQTIRTLQDLSSLTRELQGNFESDTKELVEDVSGQVEGFDNFENVQEQIGALEERIKAARDTADALTARLARARERVEARAKFEAEWEVTNSHRLRIFWGTLASVAAIIFALLIFHHFKPNRIAEASKPALDSVPRAATLDGLIPDKAKEAIAGSHTISTSSLLNPTSVQPMLKDDERLRGFDEL